MFAGGPACNTHPGERLRPLFWALISPSCSFHEVRSVHTRGQRETVRQAKKTAICIRSEWNAAPSLFETLKYLETHRCETALRLYYQPVTFLCERRRVAQAYPCSVREGRRCRLQSGGAAAQAYPCSVRKGRRCRLQSGGAAAALAFGAA